MSWTSTVGRFWVRLRILLQLFSLHGLKGLCAALPTRSKSPEVSYGSTWTHQNQQDHATGIDLFSHPATFGGFRDREGEPMRIPIEQDIWRWVWLGIAILVLTLAIVLAKNAS
jgi:hypothetical protein